MFTGGVVQVWCASVCGVFGVNRQDDASDLGLRLGSDNANGNQWGGEETFSDGRWMPIGDYKPPN